MTPEQQISLARSLADNEVFMALLDRIRDEAREALETVSATEVDAIRDLQARARVASEFRANLFGMIRSAEVAAKKPGLA